MKRGLLEIECFGVTALDGGVRMSKETYVYEKRPMIHAKRDLLRIFKESYINRKKSI